jgi:hypothetical protein
MRSLAMIMMYLTMYPALAFIDRTPIHRRPVGIVPGAEDLICAMVLLYRQ